MVVVAMSVVYVLTTPIPRDGENAIVDQIKRRNKWDNDDYVCRGLILKAFMSTSKLNDSILWHARLGHVHFKRMQDMSKDGSDSRVLRDAIFDENRFSLFPRPSLKIPNGTEDIGCSVVLEEVTKEISDQHSYCFNVEYDPKTFEEAMKSQNVAFWKEAINDEMDSILGNNTWVLADLPSGCKPHICKWIFKIKLKVDGTIEKFKARLVIQGFRRKSGIDYFDTYATVTRIGTIRLLIAMALIHNLIIHQMDVKTVGIRSHKGHINY
ncbi:zinc finger, CCHC-type containing protein [Tanacetum coccineum]